MFKRTKPFDSLEAAQKYAAKFISKADGEDLLETALKKDFTKS